MLAIYRDMLAVLSGILVALRSEGPGMLDILVDILTVYHTLLVVLKAYYE